MMKTDTAPKNLTEIEDAGTIAWLSDTLAPARDRTRALPAPDAVARMRARVLADATPDRTRRSIAA
jgi:hypothetical protein